MNKNKVVALTVAGLMTVGAVGGTFAWFTSWDSVTNVFDTGNVNNEENENGNGVEVYEKFESPEAVVPGEETTKLVQIKNTTNYDSFIRVKFDKKWTQMDGTTSNLPTDNIILNFTNNVVEYNGGEVSSIHGKWIKSGDYYYYVGRLPGGKFTSTLLNSVTLSDTSDNSYRDKKFNVEVIAESIQADNNAYESLGITDETILELLATYSTDNPNLDAGYDMVTGVTSTGTNKRD